jgi:hypothetical protein
MGNNRRKRKKFASSFFGLLCSGFGLTHEAKSKEKILTVDVEITAPCVMHSGDILIQALTLSFGKK